jgi:hypothetical protein
MTGTAPKPQQLKRARRLKIDQASKCARRAAESSPHGTRLVHYPRRMTVQDVLTALQRLPRDAELLAFEPGCEEYCERDVDDYLAS